MPGQWRPHYPFEQIAWVSPPWPSQDYVWLDFPEAIFTNQGLIFLSHVNPSVPSLYTQLPKVSWQEVADGIAFDRELPNGVRFGGSVTRKGVTVTDLRLRIFNGSAAPLKNITLQTCVFLRACREFADFSNDNKYVHVPERGWVAFSEARGIQAEKGRYSLGWRSGPRIADLPVMVILSNQDQRLLAMTWHEHTLSLIANPRHPCLHADPKFRDLDVGEEADIRGSLIFFEGTLDDFTAVAENL